MDLMLIIIISIQSPGLDNDPIPVSSDNNINGNVLIINSYLFVICPLLMIARDIPASLVISSVISPVGVTVVIMGMLPVNIR